MMRRLRRWLGPALLVTLGVAISQGAAAGFLDDIGDAFDEEVGGVFESDSDASPLDRLKADRGDGADCGGDGLATLSNARVEQGLGVVRSAALDRYLADVLAKLVAVSLPDCRVSAHATPHSTAQAVALADGGILVALGFLRNLRNEDEVAALLAHELSHILLDHHSSDSFVDTQDDLLKGMDTANAAGSSLLGFVDPTLARRLDTVASVGGAVYGVSESMIAPAWTRDQEDEADLMGTDLIVAAGYNPRAMAAIMDIIEAQEKQAAEIEAERDKLQEQQTRNSVTQSALQTDVNDTWSIVGTVADIATNALSGTKEESHRPAAERRDNVNDHIKEFHNKQRRRAFTAAPWETTLDRGESGETFERYRMAADARRAIFGGGDVKTAARNAEASIKGPYADHAYLRLAHSEVRLKQGRRSGAFESLEVAMRRDDAPWQVFRSYAEIQLGSGDVRGAAETVERADRRFDRPLGIAPFAIKVHRAANDQAKVDAYLDRCHAAGKRAHLQICLAAAGQDQETYLMGRMQRGLETDGNGDTPRKSAREPENRR